MNTFHYKTHPYPIIDTFSNEMINPFLHNLAYSDYFRIHITYNVNRQNSIRLFRIKYINNLLDKVDLAFNEISPFLKKNI